MSNEFPEFAGVGNLRNFEDIPRSDKMFVKEGEHYVMQHKESAMDRDVDDEDMVDHPQHYTWLKEKCGVEVIDIARHLNFALGNAVKYLLRAGHKREEGYSDTDKTIEDLEKAKWYINDEIERLKSS